MKYPVSPTAAAPDMNRDGRVIRLPRARRSGPFAVNVSRTERWLSALAGAGLTAVAFRRGADKKYAAAGLGLLALGVSGYCPITAAVGRNTARSDTREALRGRRGVKVESAVTIKSPLDEVYAFWRRLENLPRFMRHLRSVRELDDRRSHWIAVAPFGATVEWDAVINNEIPNELIAWRSLENSDVSSAGSVHFRELPGRRGTEVRVSLQYDPPGGKAGAGLAWLLGEEPSRQIPEDLRRFKQLLETGEGASAAPRPGTEDAEPGFFMR